MLHTVFDLNVVRSIGHVVEMEFDEIGQRDIYFDTHTNDHIVV